MSDPKESFSSDQILENYQHLNEIDWLRDEEETEYPRNQSAVSENKVVVENNNGIFTCQNDQRTEDTIS